MVKKMVLFFILIISSISFLCCSAEKKTARNMVLSYVDEVEKYLEYVDTVSYEAVGATILSLEETILHNLWAIIKGYYHTYLRDPVTIDELLEFIGTMNEMFYFHAEEFLKQNKNHLIINSDNTINLYAYKIHKKNLIIGFEREDPCSMNKETLPYLFDNQGLWVFDAQLSDSINKEIYRICFSYSDNLKIIKDGERNRYEKVLMEYTDDNLKNLCINEIMDILNNPFLKDLYKYLYSIAKENDLSRIIFSSLINDQ
ncbi:MAG: hypothetical protein LUF87_08695 [Alistipes sp.]|nr:hypothetical protein [Alistipes sp.]